MTPDYKITLPLPPSLNAAYNGDKRTGGLRRSPQYNEWIETAGFFFRQEYPQGTPRLLSGRLRAQYIIWLKDERNHDIGNYEKIISDFLQEKFYANDSQIDETHIVRRIDKTAKRNLIHVYITEIPDTRFVDMLNPAFSTQA